MGEKIGYARVSTSDQNLESQLDALDCAGCSRIFSDKISGREYKRKGLEACLDYVRSGDTMVIYRLDRLGRSVKETLELCADLERRRVSLLSLKDNLDTTTAVGRFTMQILASLAEYNRNVIVEGCKAGLEAAKRRGVRLGRKPGSRTEKTKLNAVVRLYQSGIPINEIMDITQIRSRQTVYNYLRETNFVCNRKKSLLNEQKK